MNSYKVPETFSHPDSKFALLNFAAYRQAIATNEDDRGFWRHAFERLGGFEAQPFQTPKGN